MRTGPDIERGEIEIAMIATATLAGSAIVDRHFEQVTEVLCRGLPPETAVAESAKQSDAP